MVRAGKIDGRARYWTYTGDKGESPGTGKTVIFGVEYLGQCGSGFGRKVTRKIEMRETQKLDDLHEAIIYNSFGWDDPHLYSFFMDNKPYSQNREAEYSCDPNSEFGSDAANSSKIKLADLKLKINQKFLFVFDFGDDHHFGIKVESFGEVQKGRKYPVILKEKGKAPPQYPKW